MKSQKQDKILKERYKLCPSCSNFTSFEDGNSFCPMCGEKMIENCPKCKEAIIYPTSKYCPVCGALLIRNNSNKEKEK